MNETSTPEKQPFEIPQRWLTMFAGVCLVAILGAVALSVGLWIKDGSPEVSATFGFRGGGPPGGNRAPQQQGPGNFGGQPQQGQQRGTPPQPGGQQNQNAQPNNNANIGALSRTPNFVGSVQGITNGLLTITTQQGQRVVMRINSDTLIYRASGGTGSLDDVTQGATVAVVTTNAPGMLLATELQLLR